MSWDPVRIWQKSNIWKVCTRALWLISTWNFARDQRRSQISKKFDGQTILPIRDMDGLPYKSILSEFIEARILKICQRPAHIPYFMKTKWSHVFFFPFQRGSVIQNLGRMATFTYHKVSQSISWDLCKHISVRKLHIIAELEWSRSYRLTLLDLKFIKSLLTWHKMKYLIYWFDILSITDSEL